MKFCVSWNNTWRNSMVDWRERKIFFPPGVSWPITKPFRTDDDWLSNLISSTLLVKYILLLYFQNVFGEQYWKRIQPHQFTSESLLNRCQHYYHLIRLGLLSLFITLYHWIKPLSLSKYRVLNIRRNYSILTRNSILGGYI